MNTSDTTMMRKCIYDKRGETALPPGWRRYYSAKWEEYFYVPPGGKPQWEKPEAALLMSQQPLGKVRRLRAEMAAAAAAAAAAAPAPAPAAEDEEEMARRHALIYAENMRADQGIDQLNKLYSEMIRVRASKKGSRQRWRCGRAEAMMSLSKLRR